MTLIFVSDDEIKYMDPNYNYRDCRLESINLSLNRLTFFPKGMTTLSNIATVYIMNNSIEYISPEILQNVRIKIL